MQLQFHVPMYRYDGKTLIAVDYQVFRSELIEYLQSSRVSFQSQIMKETIGEYEFDEELLVVNCTSSSILVQKYADLLIKYHNEFQHNFYVYEENGLSHTISILDGKARII